MKRIGLFIILIFAALKGFADVPYNGWWQKANAFYQYKQFDSAAAYYEKIAALHPENAVVYYNLGNSYYKLNKIGFAVLNYERALKLNPSYKEAKDNLELTQSRIPNRIQQTPEIFFVAWWQAITNASLAGMWAVISLILFLLIILILVLKRWNKLPISAPAQFTVLLAFLCVCCLYISYVAAYKKTTHEHAVILEQDAPFKETRQSSKTQSLVPEGTVIKIETQQDGWAAVKLPDGRFGWMSMALMEKI